METCSVSTGRREEMIDVTERLREVVRRKGWRRGALAVFCPHTTCGSDHQ